MSNENGWAEYSRLVLKELETLAQGIKELNDNLGDVKREIAEIRAREDKVQELVKWKERIDEVASPSQIKDLTQTSYNNLINQGCEKIISEKLEQISKINKQRNSLDNIWTHR